MSKEAMKLALEALKTLTEGHSVGGKTMGEKAIKSLETALDKQEQGEPYGYLKLNTGKFVNEVEGLNPMKDKRYLPLYTKAQPKQEQSEPMDWSDEQLKMLNFLYGAGDFDGVWFEQKHPTEKGAFWWRKHMKRLFDTTPQQRTWVGLTDREKSNLWLESRAAIPRFHTYASLVEAKLKEKNNA
jgi:hypothetical protein